MAFVRIAEGCRRLSHPKTVSEGYTENQKNHIGSYEIYTRGHFVQIPDSTSYTMGCKKMYGTLDRVWMEYNLIHVGVVGSSTLLYVPQHSFMFPKVPLCCVCVD